METLAQSNLASRMKMYPKRNKRLFSLLLNSPIQRKVL